MLSATAEAERKKVLVVDDEFNILDLIRRALIAAGYDTITAGSALDGLLALQDNPGSLLITDVKMPGMDGLDLMRQVREISPDLPIAVISGYGTEEMAAVALEHGAFYFINKPFNVESIQEVARKGMRLPSPNVAPSPKLTSKVRQRIEISVAPDIEMIKSACALVSHTSRLMGHSSAVFAVKIPFVLDELLVNEMKWRKGLSPQVETKVVVVLDGNSVLMEIQSPEPVFTEARLPKGFFEMDYSEDSPAGMRMILQFADSIIFEAESHKARVVISYDPQTVGASTHTN
ncbi:MAG: response regulator [Nitrospinota bacterium]|nr:response regulator [Nitrospinota bacterium]